MLLRTILTTGTLTLALGLAAATASAEEPAATPLFTDAAPARPVFDIAPIEVAATPLLGRPLAAAQAQATTATTVPNEHQFGAGVRLGGIGNSIGASVRYFFYGGPLGVQAEISRAGHDLGVREWTTIQFAPSAIYRFAEQTFNAPVSLTPYAGAGLSFLHNNFDDDDEDFFQDILDVDDTDVGVILYGGVEVYFERVPNLGVSGEITFNSNDDIENSTFGSASLGGVRFTAAVHWYFW